jgi:hypothetical protein
MADNSPSSIVGIITYVNLTVFGVTFQGEIFEAADVYGVAPIVGDVVLADYIPSARQWAIVTIVV